MKKKVKAYLKRNSLVMIIYRMKMRVYLWLRDVRSAYFEKSTSLQDTPFGFKLIGTGSIHHRAMQQGKFEPDETLLFKKLFIDVDIFVDVGANIGFYACLALQAKRYVIAVEPLARNLECLYANLFANKWTEVEVFPVGLSDYPGLATLYGGSSTGASLIASWAGASRSFRQIIPTSTLDILLGARLRGKKILIKIDVEGAEYSVLLGAADTIRIKPQPTWIIEICLNEYHPDGCNPNYKAIFDLFWNNGYAVYTADQHNRLIQRTDVERWIESGHCDSGTINYKFVPVQHSLL